MAEISLRHYVQEIDDLVEEGEQLEMAIAHCRHILKSFPKHIDTYRLLGKAYLESKRYGDAADLFQRVLSAVPDDFVSHVGMAIIREDEGNIDSSIWHMERAAEAKPGNPAIEQELKRLIGKRDGLEPQRVRPSRGALARMYAHGELFAYATTELKRALEEDHDRPDLQVLLADIYWRTDQRIEAAKLCSNILEKLPYCMEANRITAALLLEGGKTQQANTNLRRLIALDPYLAHMDNPMDDPHSIEASAVLVERLSWTPGQAMPASEDAQPDWAASLGVDLHEKAEEPVEEEVPTWLKPPADLPVEDQVREETPQPTIHPFAGAEPPLGADIPDWMRDAGWVESDGTATEGPSETPSSEIPTIAEEAEEQAITPAEFPDWLADISPSTQPPEEIDQAGTLEEPSLKPESLDWITEASEQAEPEASTEPEYSQFDALPETPSPDVEQFDELEDETDMRESFEDLLGSLQSSGPQPSEPTSQPGESGYFEQEGMIPSGSQELPPWLEDDAPGASETIVTWLGDKSKETAPPPSDDIPTWMRGTGPLIEIPEELSGEDAPAFDFGEEELVSSGEQPTPLEEMLFSTEDTLEDLEPEREAPTDEALPIDETEADETPGWLQEIAEIEEGEVLSATEKPGPEPDWITADMEEESPIPGSEVEEPAPGWLEEGEGTKPAPVMEDTEDEEPSPEWLKEAIGEEIDIDVDQAADEDQPEWLREIAETEGEQVAERKDADSQPPEWVAEIEYPEEESLDEIGEVEEQPPQWISTLVEDEVTEVETPSEGDQPPEWITELVPEEELDLAGGEDEEPPDWVKTGVYDRPEIEIPEELEEAAPPSDVGVPLVEEVTEVEAELRQAAPTDSRAEEAALEEPLEAEPQVSQVEEPVLEEPVLEEPVLEEPQVSQVEEPVLEEPQVSQVEEPVLEEPQVSQFEEPAMQEPLEGEEAPDWLVDISEAEAVQASAEQVDEAPDWLDEVEIGEIEAALSPGEEEIGEVAVSPMADEAGQPPQVETDWEPEFEEREGESVLDEEVAEADLTEMQIESRLDWLQDSAQEVSPEPDVVVSHDEIAEEIVQVTTSELEGGPIETTLSEETGEQADVFEGIGESIDVEIDEEEVSSFLEDLAKSEQEETQIEAQALDIPAVERESAVIDDSELPEDVEGGLEWLEQLATEEQVEEIVSPELPETADEIEGTEVPDWLQEVSETAEEFSDEDAGAAMLETLEEIEDTEEQLIEQVGEASILDTLVTSRSDLDEFVTEKEEAEREAIMEVVAEEPVDLEDQDVEAEGPTGPPMNMLDRARASIQKGDLDAAVESYVSLINQKIELEEVIEDLRSAVNKTPDVPILWQTLGDALMQTGEITEAINAYRKGMEAV